MKFKHLYLSLLVVLFTFGSVSITVYGQNPKRTKVYKKKAKKKQSKSKEPIPYEKSKKRDNDGDGVPNYYDHCHDTPIGQQVTTFGCPPDTDRDGLYDDIDDCPMIEGPKRNGGCPYLDSDDDGILDMYDVCPNTPGLKKFNGCTDRDNDGVQDSKDNCPDEYGVKGNHGCPYEEHDTDGDGIMDGDDKCILVVGPESNHGCPELKPEEEAALKEAFDNLLFETGKDIIKRSSYESLNKLATVMINNPYLKLSLSGHTDNIGDDHDNMVLSENRANSVRKYLIDRGIKGDRIKAQGLGETHPVDSNETEEGRKHNRRVEMKLDY